MQAEPLGEFLDPANLLRIAGVSASLFHLFDATPVRGRFFTATEDAAPSGAFVAVISHALWMSEFNGADVIGRHIKIGMFDLSPEGLDAIDKGEMLFALDSQQYLQGYLPVVFFVHKALYGTLPSAPVMTGPAFIEKNDAAKVMSLSKEGIR